MDAHSTNFTSARPVATGRQLKANAEEIKFAIGKSELGLVLVARSATGICAILIGDEADALKRDLAGEFTEGKFVQDDGALRTDLAKVVIFIKTPTKGRLHWPR